ncbi:hypothetical protein IMSAGC019_01729 [Lachnospiraceae bacterium]|nr:hypothetical protein IMSAGC019_01729 [Lachnospiraceae bacterium]
MDYKNWRRFNETAILRHDVDFSLKKAIVLSEIEKEVCENPTYFTIIFIIYILKNQENVLIIS